MLHTIVQNYLCTDMMLDFALNTMMLVSRFESSAQIMLELSYV